MKPITQSLNLSSTPKQRVPRSSLKQRASRAATMLVLTGSILLTACVTERKGGAVVNEERRVDIAVKAATEYLKLGDLDRAHGHLERALELNDRHAPAYNLLALLYIKEGDEELTEKNYKKAIRFDDEFAPALNNYGAFLYSQQRYEEAIEYLEKAAKDVGYDKRHQAYENLGATAMALGDQNKAIDAYQNVIRLVDNSPVANLELAAIYLNRGELKWADRYYKNHLAVAKQTPRSLWLGIQIVRRTGDKDAEASYALALRNLFPNSLEYKRYEEQSKR